MWRPTLNSDSLNLSHSDNLLLHTMHQISRLSLLKRSSLSKKYIDWKLPDRCRQFCLPDSVIVHQKLFFSFTSKGSVFQFYENNTHFYVVDVVEVKSHSVLLILRFYDLMRKLKVFIFCWLIPCCQQLLADFKVEHHSVRKFGFRSLTSAFTNPQRIKYLESGVNINVISSHDPSLAF